MDFVLISYTILQFDPASYIPVQRVPSEFVHAPYELRSKDLMDGYFS